MERERYAEVDLLNLFMVFVVIYRGWTMKLKHLVLQHNNLLVW